MTDKQIIIDGVDVSGCVHFIQEEKDCCDLGGNCKGWANCYYKRLKRKEQECDMWKNLTVDNGAVALKYQQQLDQLKAENDELKKNYFTVIQQRNKAEKTLTEIKEIVEKGVKIHDDIIVSKQILQKISEANNDMENN